MFMSPRVLVVDDEPYIRRSLSFVLSQEGYEVE
ncbi:MAG: DNA-binding response regulator, partial [Chloroflexi bacterium]|nr:DNA-binding response regulator [Chloroflexota bacterium]